MFMFMFVCLCPFCAQFVLQVSFMCCVVEVLFDVVLFCAVLKAGCMFLSCAEMLVLEPAQLIIYSHAGTLSI